VKHGPVSTAASEASEERSVVRASPDVGGFRGVLCADSCGGFRGVPEECVMVCVSKSVVSELISKLL